MTAVVDGTDPIDTVTVVDGDGTGIDLIVGQPTWVPARRAVLIDGVLADVPVMYRLDSARQGDVTVAAISGELRPTPESVWRIARLE